MTNHHLNVIKSFYGSGLKSVDISDSCEVSLCRNIFGDCYHCLQIGKVRNGIDGIWNHLETKPRTMSRPVSVKRSSLLMSPLRMVSLSPSRLATACNKVVTDKEKELHILIQGQH